ncbi:hypothetical protein DEO72_LG8g1859 [Vigna unguiculata]|uniref:Uncharacterized protein n=1 Tax=Vigna unguiculata TaxID=3917 RepID=A0A4D6MQK3_VIGUN|nr:hypothetical protein DEO72_LG8g1859 [Vigna unguiculata]
MPTLGAAVIRLLLKNRHTRGHCTVFLPSETSPAIPTSTRDVDVENQGCSTFALSLSSQAWLERLPLQRPGPPSTTFIIFLVFSPTTTTKTAIVVSSP